MALTHTIQGAAHQAVPTPPLTLDAVSGPPLASITVRPEKPLVLGRSGQSDAILGDESVSRRHCSISARQGTWFIEDLGSRHGTFVQSARLGANESTPLKNGDLIGVGPWMLRARIGGGTGTGTAMPASTGQRLVTLMEPGMGGAGGATGSGRGAASSAMRERVERVQERELAAMNQNRLKLLIDVAAAVAGTGDEESLAKMIVQAAVQGTGFPRAFLLRDETVAALPGGTREAGGPAPPPTTDTLRVVFEVDPEAAVGGAAAASASSFSRSLIAAARKGEVVRLTSDAPMQAVSIMALGIQTALCAPITIGAAVGGFLYLDSRTGEKGGPKTGGVVAPAVGGSSVGVHSDAAAFCSALAKMYSLAVGNISRHELEKRQRELVRDLEAASEAQKLIMPPAKGKIGRVKYAMRSKSGRYVAGDLFDVVDLGDGRVGVLLGDVAGKGVPAAILMATAQTHLHVALSEGMDPARAVTAANKHICTHMASNKFISLWIGVFEPLKGGGAKVSYVDAGHGYWMVTRGDKPPLRTESASAIPLGVDASYEFGLEKVEIGKGERLIVFSDGVVEQPSGAEGEGGEQFGVAGAMAAMKGSTTEQDDVDRIFEAVLAHAKGPNLADDTTVASVGVE